MIKVAFNIIPLKSGHKGRGVGFYTQNLLDELKKNTTLEIQEFTDLREVRNADVVHYPFFDLFYPSLPLRKKFLTVVTVHDVIPLIFPKIYLRGIKGNLRYKFQKFSLKSADSVITVSNSSKQDISKFLDYPENKIEVIYSAPNKSINKITDQNYLRKIKKDLNLPNQFALYVGDVNWNKNINNLAKACLMANLPLILVGKGFTTKTNLDNHELSPLKQFLENFQNNPNIKILGYLDNDILSSVYSLASVLMLPSFYEGFGFTILEAQKCGVPVITSNVSSMPEVAGDGALYIHPEDVSDISAKIIQLKKDTNLRQELIDKGIKNIQKFSWEKCAKDTISVYQILKNY